MSGGLLRELKDLGPDDKRFLHHMVLLGQGYVLDRAYEGLDGLRVYRLPGAVGGRNSVDVYRGGEWNRYDENSACVSGGVDVDALRKEFCE